MPVATVTSFCSSVYCPVTLALLVAPVSVSLNVPLAVTACGAPMGGSRLTVIGVARVTLAAGMRPPAKLLTRNPAKSTVPSELSLIQYSPPLLGSLTPVVARRS